MKIFKENDFNQQLLIEIYRNCSKEHILETKKSKGFNLLHAAAYYGLDDLFKHLISITDGDGLQTQDEIGRTPIHHLASNGLDEILSFVLDNYLDQINLEQINNKGRTALHSAAKHLKMDAVVLLVSKGANPNALDVNWHTPLSLAYERHFPGYEIPFSHSVIDFLLPLTTYWQKQFQNNDFLAANNINQEVSSAWWLGMKHTIDNHWIPGITITLNTDQQEDQYIVQSIDSTNLTKFIIVSNAENNILICLDKAKFSQKAIYLERHVKSQYQSELSQRILPKLENIHQIWGIELAGIDAQLLAKSLNIQKLILINAPGLPRNLLPVDAAHTECHYFFAHEDKLHGFGQHLWAQGANFYTNNEQESEIQNIKKKSSLLKWALKEQNPSLKRFNSIQKIQQYIPGKDYEPIEAKEEEKDIENTLMELFTNTNLALNNIADEELINFAQYEYCAHGLAYLHLSDNQKIVRWWDTQELLSLQRIIHHQGLYCYLLQNQNDFILMFQGTNPADLTTIARDLDRGSAGIKRIRYQYIDIINTIANKIQNNDEKVNFTICGHSLGGADAQNFFTSFLAYLACEIGDPHSNNKRWMKFYARNKSSQNLLSKINEVSLYAYNGAGIRKSTAELAKGASEKLKHLLKISINHQRVNQDIVNIVGETILYDFDTTTDTNGMHPIKVRSLFFEGRPNFSDRIKHAHVERQFFNKEIGSYKLYHENNQGRENLKNQIEYTNPKMEPTSCSGVKRFVQKGNTSERLSETNIISSQPDF